MRHRWPQPDYKSDDLQKFRKFIVTVLSTLLVAAIVGNASAIWNFNARLSRIEAQLEYLFPQLAQKKAP